MADMRTLYFQNDDGDWSPVELHAVDAAHALEVDPDHWKVEKPASPVEPIDEPEKYEPENDE